MAETPSVTPTTASGSDPDHWCYQCEKRVSVETLADLPDVICFECKNGFVESIPSSRAVSATPVAAPGQIDDPSFGNQFLQVLRLIAQDARDDDAPPPPPSEHADRPSDDEYLRVELEGWGNDEDEENDEEIENGDGDENRRIRSLYEDDDGDDEDEEDGVNDEDEGNEDRGEERDEEEELRRRRRDVLRLRLRDFAARAASRRNRILDWAEILMGLEDHSIELRLQVPEVDGFMGNPGDYVDAAGYEALLQTLAESDSSGRRGAPPASKSAVEGLDTLVIKAENEGLVCAICKDVVNVGETAKKLPCGHSYHGDCIVPWLGSRNSCPVCRYELPTDDQEYEDERKKRGRGASATTTATSNGSSSSGQAAAASCP